MNKDTRKNTIKQAPDNKISFLSGLNRKRAKTLNELVTYDNLHGLICPGQKKLAQKAGYESVRTIGRLIVELQELNLIKVRHRYNQTNVYTLSPIFYLFEFREMLKHLIPALGMACKFIPLTLLSSLQAENVRLITPSLFNNNVVNRIPCNTLSLVSKDIVTLSDRSKKEGKFMEMSKILDGIPGLNISAKCKLSVYPDKVVLEALKSVQGGKEIGNPFGYLWSTCNKIGTRDTVRPDWNKYYTLKKMYGVSEAEEFDLVVYRGSLGNSSVQGNKVTPQEKSAERPGRSLSDAEYYRATDQSVLRPMGFNLDEKKAAEGKLTKKEIAEYIRKLGTKHWIIYHHLYVKLLEDNKANGGLDHDFIESKETTEFIAMKEEIAHAFNITDDNGKIINKKDESVSLTLEKLQQNFNAVLKTKHPEASNVLFIADDLDKKDTMLIFSPLEGTSAIEHVANPPASLSDNTLQDFIDISVGDYYDDDIDTSVYI